MDRLLVVEAVELLPELGQLNADSGARERVQLDDYVHFRPDRLSDRADPIAELRRLART